MAVRFKFFVMNDIKLDRIRCRAQIVLDKRIDNFVKIVEQYDRKIVKAIKDNNAVAFAHCVANRGINLLLLKELCTGKEFRRNRRAWEKWPKWTRTAASEDIFDYLMRNEPNW